MQQRAELGPIGLFIGPTLAGTFKPEHSDSIGFTSWCGTGQNAVLSAAGVLDIVPAHYSDLPILFAQGLLASDVVLLTLSEPDKDGRFNLGLVNDYIIAAARRARLVIAEVNDRVPWVYGAELPADIVPDVVLTTHREPTALPEVCIEDATEAERIIAGRVATLIPDGATLALGIGTLPDLILQRLRDHRDLGIHSGAIGNGIVDLVQAGVITNAKKPTAKGVSVASILMGGPRLLAFAHRNRAIRLGPIAETHDIDALRAIPDLFAITSVVEVDIFGQVNAESVNGKYIGAVGGQVDFVKGANGSRGGHSIMILPSTTRDNSASRIVTRLTTGTVTTARSDVDLIVTEFGIAALRGKSLCERIGAMVAIAHPDFRQELEREAYALIKGR